jgi:hypothetical protein
MRKTLIVGIVSVTAFAAISVPAFGSFASHFTVITDAYDTDRLDDGFRFRERIFQIDNPSNQIGNDRGRCVERPRNKFLCKVLVHLNGEVGGLGFLRLKGNIGPGDNRLNVTGGTGDFAGVAGKVNIHGPRGQIVSFALVR